jgi:hypothetical protein
MCRTLDHDIRGSADLLHLLGRKDHMYRAHGATEIHDERAVFSRVSGVQLHGGGFRNVMGDVQRNVARGLWILES